MKEKRDIWDKLITASEIAVLIALIWITKLWIETFGLVWPWEILRSIV